MHAALRVKRLCNPFSHAICCEKTAADLWTELIIKNYLLVVFDLIVHYVGRRLFHLWPGEGDAVVRGRVLPDLSHQSRTCRDTAKLRDGRLQTCLNMQQQEGTYPKHSYLSFSNVFLPVRIINFNLKCSIQQEHYYNNLPESVLAQTISILIKFYHNWCICFISYYMLWCMCSKLNWKIYKWQLPLKLNK